MQKSILVTGGAGFIGSHTVVELLNRNYKVIVVDNLCNSSAESLRRVEKITGKTVQFYQADICDKAALEKIFSENEISNVIHFAGLKAVGESCQKPLLYYQNNIGGTLTLLEVMTAHNVKSIVFSSSATVYGDPERLPIDENCRLATTNPYGATKLMQEDIFRDIYKADKEWKIVLLRYFNPVGAHESGIIGEDPNGIPNNLMPYVAQVASGKLQQISVFGNDYPTPDGTGVRDYIHVVDLANAHLKAVEKLGKSGKYGLKIINLGTGNGYSVLQIVKAFEAASGRKVPYAIKARRPGDVGEVWADPSYAAKELGWKAERGIEKMCEDLWRWQSMNPYGFGKGD